MLNKFLNAENIDNAVLLHPYCNRLKSDRTEEEARAALFGA